MSDAFRHLLRVRYSECDAQQVVFNAKYAEYADIAATEYLRAVFGGYQNLLEEGNDNQVVSLTINWRAPARFDDVLAISVEVDHIGTSSYSLALQFFQHDSEHLIAESKIVYVLVDAKEFTKKAIPQSYREKLKVGAPGVVSNHAGVV